MTERGFQDSCRKHHSHSMMRPNRIETGRKQFLIFTSRPICLMPPLACGIICIESISDR